MSDSVCLSRQFYARIERGQALPSVSALKRISETLDVDVDGLLGLAAGVPLDATGGRAGESVQDDHAQPGCDPLPVRRALRRLRRVSTSQLRLVEWLLDELAPMGSESPPDFEPSRSDSSGRIARPGSKPSGRP